MKTRQATEEAERRRRTQRGLTRKTDVPQTEKIEKRAVLYFSATALLSLRPQLYSSQNVMRMNTISEWMSF